MDRILPRLARWYLRKPRRSRYAGAEVVVPPGVFHPGLFLSTRVMLDYLANQPVEGQSLLEMGAGSGLISIVSAQRGAIVTATDISQLAVAAILENADANEVKLTVVLSDLFADLDDFAFDIVVINPPYYPRDPTTAAEHAWFCGAEFEYFHRLFRDLHRYCHVGSHVWMVLSEDCRIAEIEAIARQNGWEMPVVHSVRRFGEWNYIFRVGRRKVI